MAFTSVPTGVTPDVSYWVNQGLSQVDANAAAANSAAANALAQAVAVAARVDRGLVPDATDMNTMKGSTKAGAWYINGATSAGTMTNLPPGVNGTCNVFVLSGMAGYGSSFQLVAVYGTGAALWYRSMSSTTAWNAWARLDSNTTLLADGTDILSLTGFANNGIKYISSATSAGTMLNKPAGIPNAPAVVTVKSGHMSGYGFTEITWVNMGAEPGIYQTTLKSSGVFNPWVKVVTSSVTTPGKRERSVAAYQAVAVGDFIRRRGWVGTGDIGAVAFRYDHNPAFFDSKGILAKHRELNLPATMNLNSRGWTSEYSKPETYTPVTKAQVQDWALYDGIELANHGATHGNCDTEARIIEEIRTGAAELRAAFPKVAIEQWHAPGSQGTVNMGFGYGDAGDPDEWAEYLAGQEILGSHAFAGGYGGGKLHPLNGVPTNGLNHYSVEELSAAGIIAVIQAAQNQGAAAKLMMHPNVLDLTGKITTADWFSVLEYAAAERDAGRLLVLTTGGLLMADSRISTRHNLVRNAGFKGGFGQWAGTSGWSAGDAEGEVKTTTGGLLYQTFNLDTLASHAGGVREIYAQVKSTAGATVSLQLEDTTTPANYTMPSKDVVIPGDGQWHDVRTFATLPLTGTGTLTLRMGRISGGDVTLRKPGLLAA